MVVLKEDRAISDLPNPILKDDVSVPKLPSTYVLYAICSPLPLLNEYPITFQPRHEGHGNIGSNDPMGSVMKGHGKWEPTLTDYAPHRMGKLCATHKNGDPLDQDKPCLAYLSQRRGSQ